MIEKRVSFNQKMSVMAYSGDLSQPGVSVDILYIPGYENQTRREVEAVFNRILNSIGDSSE